MRSFQIPATRSVMLSAIVAATTRLRGEAGNRRAADVMDLGYQAGAGGHDLLTRGREVCSPSRVVRRQDDHEPYRRTAASPRRSTPAAAISV